MLKTNTTLVPVTSQSQSFKMNDFDNEDTECRISNIGACHHKNSWGYL